jgi:hypothetical protein
MRVPNPIGLTGGPWGEKNSLATVFFPKSQAVYIDLRLR